MKIKSFMSMAFAVVLLMGTGAFAEAQEEKSKNTEMSAEASAEQNKMMAHMKAYHDRVNTKVNKALEKAGVDKEAKDHVNAALSDYQMSQRNLVGGPEEAFIEKIAEKVLELAKELVVEVPKFAINTLCNDPENINDIAKCAKGMEDVGPKGVALIDKFCYAVCSRYMCGNTKKREACKVLCCEGHSDKIDNCLKKYWGHDKDVDQCPAK